MSSDTAAEPSPNTRKLINHITEVLNEANLRYLWSKQDLDIQAVCGTFLQTFRDTLKTLLQRQQRQSNEIDDILAALELEPDPERFGTLRPANFFTAVALFCLQAGIDLPAPGWVQLTYPCKLGTLTMDGKTKQLYFTPKQPAHHIHLSFELGKDGTVYSPDPVV